MRNKRETDISRYTERTADTTSNSVRESGIKHFFKGFGKVLLTVCSVCFVALFIAGISLSIYIVTLASEPTGIDLKAKSLNQTSFILVQNSKTGEFEDYQSLYSSENRIWVDNQDIPQTMKDAIIAIEDKRFYEHNGVDWTRTLSAVVNLFTGDETYGGSTLTQQLIKNITDDNEVSLTRKLREICKALKLENEYTKDQILEAYLNVVNFGNNCQGVEAASQLYFGKSITECSIAECAAIAGITQNPSLYNPLVYPDKNQEKCELVIKQMCKQGMITEEEKDQAIEESKNMTFVGFTNVSDDDEEEEDQVQNWYIDELYYDLQADIAELYGISEDAASDKLFTEGLHIYCAMDVDMQNYIESEALKIDKTYDSDLQIGSTLMAYDGRVIATVGSSNKKTGALNFDRATMAKLQPGSTIKPVAPYPIAIEQKQLYYSSTIKDEPLDNYKEVDGKLVAGPDNWYKYYKGTMLLPDAIEWSANATAAQAIELIGGPSVAYEQLVTKMGFSNLSEQDAYNTGALSIGGTNGGASVREMAAAYTYMGNGGLYYEPYTYYYVTDSEGNVILDNRSVVPKKAYSAETAGIMNRLLHYNVTNCAHTNAAYARVSGWDIIGKTGTTDADTDAWFCGCSPYAVMATWCGFDTPATVSAHGTTIPASFFSNIMGKYLDGKEQKEYTIPSTLIEAEYNPYTGLIVSTENVSGKYIGYYTEDNMPAYGGAYNYSDYTSSDDNNYIGENDSSNSNSGGSNGESSAAIDASSGSESSSAGGDSPGSDSSDTGSDSPGGESSDTGSDSPGGESSAAGEDNPGSNDGGESSAVE